MGNEILQVFIASLVGALCGYIADEHTHSKRNKLIVIGSLTGIIVVGTIIFINTPWLNFILPIGYPVGIMMGSMIGPMIGGIIITKKEKKE